MTDLDFIREFTNNDLPLQDDKTEYLTCNSLLKGYVGPRSCGKTYLLYQDLVCNAFHNKGDYLVLAPNFPTLLSIRIYVSQCLDQFALSMTEIETSFCHTVCRLPNKSTVTFAASSSDALIYIGNKRYDIVYIDEPQHIRNFEEVIETFTPVVQFYNGYIGVFGTIDAMFYEYLIAKGFDLTHHLD